MIVVVSPHLDDAVFSVAEWMITHRSEPIEVVTVFAGEPAHDEGREHVRQRRLEDIEALGLLGVSWRHLPWLDECYRESVEPDILASLQPLLQSADTVLFPLGIKHPDHVKVARVGADLPKLRARVGFYEELPYRVMCPEETADRVADLSLTCNLTVTSCCGGHLEDKHAAVQCYGSQVGEDVQRCVLAPERIWWVL